MGRDRRCATSERALPPRVLLLRRVVPPGGRSSSMPLTLGGRANRKLAAPAGGAPSVHHQLASGMNAETALSAIAMARSTLLLQPRASTRSAGPSSSLTAVASSALVPLQGS